jgi:hypothetical protein
VDKEGALMDTLSRSQYLYLVSRALNVFTSIPRDRRTESINALIAKAPIVVYQHYSRWIFLEPTFSVTGWGCHGSESLAVSKEGRHYFTHAVFLRLKRKGKLRKDVKEPKYCNAVTDVDLWIVAGFVELLSANKNMPGMISLAEIGEGEVRDYLGNALRLIKSRLSKTKLRDFEGRRATGVVFDRGVWSEHPNNAYAGYEGEAYPTESDKKASSKISWDLSHARRFVHVFGTFYRNRDVTEQKFPTDKTMRRLANQYAYAAFNKDLSMPLFNNYLDGTNGWYRVGYMKRKGFGYGPSKLSPAGLTGGYGFWKEFNPDIDRINEALWNMVNSSDPAVQAHVEHFFYSSEDDQNYILLTFLPVFVWP